jgi:hypothetical protein
MSKAQGRMNSRDRRRRRRALVLRDGDQCFRCGSDWPADDRARHSARPRRHERSRQPPALLRAVQLGQGRFTLERRLGGDRSVKIVKGFPPNYAEIKARLNPGPRTVFAYGDTIYSPSTTHAAARPDRARVRALRPAAARRRPRSVVAPLPRRAAVPARAGGRGVPRPVRALLAAAPRDAPKVPRAHQRLALSSPMYGRLVTKEQAKLLVAGAAA